MKRIFNIIKVILCFFVFFWLFNNINANLDTTIHSTNIWGRWDNISTWEEWRIPSENDVVKINWDVRITWNTNISWLEISSSWSIARKLSYDGDYYTLTINWDIESYWKIWVWNAPFENKFNIVVNWNTTNNWTIQHYNKFIARWDINNPDWTSWSWNLEIDWLGIKRNYSFQNIAPRIKLLSNTKITWDFNLKNNLTLNNQSLYIDWKSSIYIKKVHWEWWIYSLTWNWDWEKIRVSEIHNWAKTNIEEIEVESRFWSVDARKLNLIWNIRLYENVNYTWSLYISSSWSIARKLSYDGDYYTLTINWDIESYWKNLSLKCPFWE